MEIESFIKVNILYHFSQTNSPTGDLWYRERVGMVGNASLLIFPIQRDDDGTYRCQVTSLPNFHQGEAMLRLHVNCMF